MTQQNNGTTGGRQSFEGLKPENERIMPRVPLTKKVNTYLVLGLGNDGNIVKMQDELGMEVPAVVRANTVYYVREVAATMMKNPAIPYVWFGMWNDKSGKYLFSGKDAAIARKLSVGGSSTSSPIPGVNEFKLLETQAKDIVKSLKEKKPVSRDAVNAAVTALFDGLRTIRVSREDMLAILRTAAPELGAQPQHQPANR